MPNFSNMSCEVVYVLLQCYYSFTNDQLVGSGCCYDFPVGNTVIVLGVHPMDASLLGFDLLQREVTNFW